MHNITTIIDKFFHRFSGKSLVDNVYVPFLDSTFLLAYDFSTIDKPLVVVYCKKGDEMERHYVGELNDKKTNYELNSRKFVNIKVVINFLEVVGFEKDFENFDERGKRILRLNYKKSSFQKKIWSSRILIRCEKIKKDPELIVIKSKERERVGFVHFSALNGGEYIGGWDITERHVQRINIATLSKEEVDSIISGCGCGKPKSFDIDCYDVDWFWDKYL